MFVLHKNTKRNPLCVNKPDSEIIMDLNINLYLFFNSNLSFDFLSEEQREEQSKKKKTDSLHNPYRCALQVCLNMNEIMLTCCRCVCVCVSMQVCVSSCDMVWQLTVKAHSNSWRAG